MRIAIDHAKCSGIGLCELTVPTVFEIGDDGQAHVTDAAPPPDVRRAIEDAVLACPTGAVSATD